MAAIEKLEIHSKSYILRWVRVEEGHTLSWSVQPAKKSINFGVVKHPGSGGSGAASVSSSSHAHHTHDDADLHTHGPGGGAFHRGGSSGATAQEILEGKGFVTIRWCGKCEADKATTGTYDVPPGQAGMYGLVFDNTFSKQTSKTAALVLLTYPTGSPPQPSHHHHHHHSTGAEALAHSHPRSAQASQSQLSLGRYGPAAAAAAAAHESVDSFHSPRSLSGLSETGGGGGMATPKGFYAGTLQKRRRKKGQGYARRFFSLDYSTCTLSYYHDRGSAALRGSIPLSLAAIAADEKRREISIDSGAEVWHLKALTAEDFADWATALERAGRIARGMEGLAVEAGVALPARIPHGSPSSSRAPHPLSSPETDPTAAAASNPQEEREWQQVETLVSRVVGTRDAVRRLVKDLAAAESGGGGIVGGGGGVGGGVGGSVGGVGGSPHALGIYLSPGSASAATPTPTGPDEGDGYFAGPAERRSFWKRKSSAASSPMTPMAPLQPAPPGAAGSSSLPVPSPAGTPILPSSNPPRSAKRGSVTAAAMISAATTAAATARPRSQPQTRPADARVFENCQALLRDLDSVVAEFTTMIASSKRRRAPAAAATAAAAAAAAAAAMISSPGRASIETMSTDEFFDAEAGETGSQILRIDRSDDEEEEEEEGLTHETRGSESAGSSADEADETVRPGSSAGAGSGASAGLYPPRPKSLAPLPISESVRRRTTIPSATEPPPSLIGFLRKNVGKDLSTISMPVSSNEPTSLLQKFAEQLEYGELLDRAARLRDPIDRLLHVTAFAVSQFSSGRARERALRKPFNPLLGETYELLRTESEIPGGMRLLVEKVSHRPVRLAMHADGAAWSLAQSPAPANKFWGKSAEIITDGRVRVSLRLQGPAAPSDGAADELYSWNTATMYLKNIVMGEKYIEPAGTMAITNDTTGARAAVEFRTKGVFGGRSEEVRADLYGPDGAAVAGAALVGSWTSSLRVDGGGHGGEIWRIGALVDRAADKYGMTVFAAGLNEITALEQGRLPPTDSRLRPDQRLVEEGRLDDADETKVKLEEAQRVRRRAMEEQGAMWTPRWFVRAGAAEASDGEGEEVWRIRTGRDGYWEERARGEWTGVEPIFDLEGGTAAGHLG